MNINRWCVCENKNKQLNSNICNDDDMAGLLKGIFLNLKQFQDFFGKSSSLKYADVCVCVCVCLVSHNENIHFDDNKSGTSVTTAITETPEGL